jgi:hypothetical protein
MPARLILLFAAFHLLFASQKAFAQRGSLEVFVYDSVTKEEIPFVKISFSGSSLSYNTDFSGYLRINSPDTGKQKLQLFFLGYETINKEVEIIAEKSMLLVFCMRANTIQLRIPEDPDPKPHVPTRFDSLVNKADSCFVKKKYGLAQNYYFHAGAQQPESSYWLTRIRECGRLQNPPVDDYTQLVQTGDSYFPEKYVTTSNITKNTLLAAKACYEMALKLKPQEKYPGEQLKKLNELLKKK